MAEIVYNEAAIDEFLYSPTGPVAREIERRAIQVQALAVSYCSGGGAGYVYTTLVRTRLRGVPRGTPGRLWFIGSRSPHQASLPYAHPAKDSGELAASIDHELAEGVEGPAQDIVARAYYARFVELGTRYMEERPFLRPALYEGFDL